jgi:hypothetical protein
MLIGDEVAVTPVAPAVASGRARATGRRPPAVPFSLG